MRGRTVECAMMSQQKSSQLGHYKTSRPPIWDIITTSPTNVEAQENSLAGTRHASNTKTVARALATMFSLHLATSSVDTPWRLGLSPLPCGFPSLGMLTMHTVHTYKSTLAPGTS